MASHADVANRFAQYITPKPNSRDLKGSRMHARFSWTGDRGNLPGVLNSPLNTPLNSPHTHLFSHVAFGESYATVIARLVRNNHTENYELWLSERRYSVSTDRHRSLYRSAFVRQCSALGIHPYVYLFTSSAAPRNDISRVAPTLAQTSSVMYTVARRGFHTATRVTALINQRAAIDVTLRHMTEGVPVQWTSAYAEEIDTLHTHRRTIETMLASPETIKAAALGWLALNDIDPPPQRTTPTQP